MRKHHRECLERLRPLAEAAGCTGELDYGSGGHPHYRVSFPDGTTSPVALSSPSDDRAALNMTVQSMRRLLRSRGLAAA